MRKQELSARNGAPATIGPKQWCARGAPRRGARPLFVHAEERGHAWRSRRPAKPTPCAGYARALRGHEGAAAPVAESEEQLSYYLAPPYPPLACCFPKSKQKIIHKPSAGSLQTRSVSHTEARASAEAYQLSAKIWFSTSAGKRKRRPAVLGRSASADERRVLAGIGTGLPPPGTCSESRC